MNFERRISLRTAITCLEIHRLQLPIAYKQDKTPALPTSATSMNSTFSIRDINTSILYTRDINNSFLSIRDINTSTLSIRDINNSTLSLRDINNSTVSHNRDIKNINHVILNLWAG
ncbi:hypothetical protein PoB_006054600 [Plakobranchus ocellatus]|uniref:Uncharacterized protein n=1 Tax=Plakobranchus ocellatus TaxID=259542 RepID=A0AAV4CQB6_9GAST|nr:hypothetical protein PoB_006054600 [Plakobranchus ocellatus]